MTSKVGRMVQARLAGRHSAVWLQFDKAGAAASQSPGLEIQPSISSATASVCNPRQFKSHSNALLFVRDCPEPFPSGIWGLPGAGHSQGLRQARGSALGLGYGHISRGFAAKRLSVVLRRPVPNLGQAGTVVRVSPGYARNYLIPQRKAFPALPKYLQLMQEEREKGLLDMPPEGQAADSDTSSATSAPAVLSEQDRASEAALVAERLDKLVLSIRRLVPRKSSELRQPIALKDIIAEVARQFGVALEPQNLTLQAPLSTLGEFDVPVVFPPEVELPGGKEQILLKIKVRRK